jgi:predicted ABC-type ATPase
LRDRKSLIFETVLSTQEKLEYIARAKACGYFVRLFFVGTDSPTINAARIAQRVIEGGHDVPISKIISRYGKSIANCAIGASIVDRAYVYDNSVDFADPRLLFRTVDGLIEKTYGDVSDWANDIFRSLKHV